MSFPTFTSTNLGGGIKTFGDNFNPPPGPPKGITFPKPSTPLVKPVVPIVRPTTPVFSPKPVVPIVRPNITATLTNSMPKIDDNGVQVIPRSNVEIPPRGINTTVIPIKTQTVLTNPTINVAAIKPIATAPSNIKVASFSTTVVDELGKPIANANLYLDNVAVGLTDANGFVSKVGFNPLAKVKISFVGFQPFEGLASQIPAKVVLINETLDAVVIKNRTAKKFPWLMVILGAVVVYGGYKYFFDEKSNSVVKVKL